MRGEERRIVVQIQQQRSHRSQGSLTEDGGGDEKAAVEEESRKEARREEMRGYRVWAAAGRRGAGFYIGPPLPQPLGCRAGLLTSCQAGPPGVLGWRSRPGTGTMATVPGRARKTCFGSGCRAADHLEIYSYGCFLPALSLHQSTNKIVRPFIKKQNRSITTLPRTRSIYFTARRGYDSTTIQSS
jgi:hypothetical protein